MDKTRRILVLISSGLIVLLTALGSYVMLTNTNEGILTVYGISNLKFFTVDSNLLLGLTHLAYLILAVTGVLDNDDRVRLWMERLVYIATVAVSLTFTVVVFFFAPSLGLSPLLQDANLYFHLIIPVLAIVICCALHRGRVIPMKETAMALIPPVLYGVYYTLILLTRGVHFPETDWYGFANGGIVGSALTACGIFLVTWALALLLRLAAGSTYRQARHKQTSEV